VSARWRAIAAGALAAVLASAIGVVFWQQDLRYALPTPRPAGWQPATVGAAVVLPAALERLRADRPGRPVLLHFFNPSCPCSRFNVDHVRALASRFRTEVTVVAVLAEGDPASMQSAYRALSLDVPHYVDADRRLAEALGVYATPQAAILDGAGRVYFVGNYNRTRFCRDRETEFARLALEAVVAGARPPAVTPAAITAFGCPLPARQARGARL
jgi:peroxiredoxin